MSKVAPAQPTKSSSKAAAQADHKQRILPGNRPRSEESDSDAIVGSIVAVNKAYPSAMLPEERAAYATNGVTELMAGSKMLMPNEIILQEEKSLLGKRKRKQGRRSKRNYMAAQMVV